LPPDVIHILKIKCTKFDLDWASAPDPAGRTYSAPTDPLAGFKEPTVKEGRKDRKGERGGNEGRRPTSKGREERKDGREGQRMGEKGREGTYF